MTFLQPAALAFLALAPIVIALYLLKVRRRPVPVSTLLFWQRALAEHRQRALFQRLRRLLSLLLQLLIFALLLLALARPEFFGFAAALGKSDGATVLVLDGRARMQALQANGESCFSRARALALAHARRAAARHPVALLVVDGPAPRVLAPFSTDDRALVAALDVARPTDAGGRLEDAIDLAEQLLAAHAGTHEILVFTDQPLDAARLPRVPASAIVRVSPVAGSDARENIAITRLAVRPLPASPQTVEVFLQLTNAGTHRTTGEVELAFDGRVFDVRPFDLAPGEKRIETYPALPMRPGAAVPANARGWLTAHLRLRSDGGLDALRLDDDAYAILPAPRPLRVLLVTRGNWFLENLLRASAGDTEFQQLAPDAFQPALAASFDAVILDDYLPDAGFSSLDDLPSAGNFLFIRRAPARSLAVAASLPLVLDRPPVTDFDPGSPLLRLVDWRSVGILRAVSFPPLEETVRSPDDGAPAIWRLAAPVRSAERPLVLSGERALPSPATHRQRFVALAFGLAESDLPLRVAFPLFMSNTLRWLADRDSENDATPAVGSRSLRAGETLRVAAGETLWTRPQRSGDNGGILRPLPEPLPAAETLRGPGAFQPRQNGFYLLRGPGGDRWLAVNTDDPTMAQLNSAEPRGADALSAGATRVVTPDFLPHQRWTDLARGWPPWVWLAVGAFLFSALEWWLFHRRRTE